MTEREILIKLARQVGFCLFDLIEDRRERTISESFSTLGALIADAMELPTEGESEGEEI